MPRGIGRGAGQPWRSVGSRTEFRERVFGPAGGIVVGSGFGIAGEATEREMVRRQNRSEVEEEELRATGGRERVGLSSSVVLQAWSGMPMSELEREEGGALGVTERKLRVKNERGFPPFFLQMTARVCGGVPSPLIEPIMGREGKGPT